VGVQVTQGFEAPQTLEGQLRREMHRIQHEVIPRYDGLGASGNATVYRLQRIAAKAQLAIERGDRLRMIRCLSMFGEY
jgi:hypothetical protein